jgi:hypothetical protein
MTLGASPAWKAPTVTMPICSGGTLRADDGLQRHHDADAATTGSTAACGMAPWPPLPRTLMMAVSELAMAKPGTADELAHGQAGHVVHAEHRVAGEQVEEAVLEHLARAGLAFFGRLEHEVQDAVEVARGRQVARRASSMAVWPSWPQACILPSTWLDQALAAGLGDGQRVHVGTQADAARGVPALQRADHAGAAQAAVHLVAPALQRSATRSAVACSS